jgi:hypothetical protein
VGTQAKLRAVQRLSQPKKIQKESFIGRKVHSLAGPVVKALTDKTDDQSANLIRILKKFFFVWEKLTPY